MGGRYQPKRKDKSTQGEVERRLNGVMNIYNVDLVLAKNSKELEHRDRKVDKKQNQARDVMSVSERQLETEGEGSKPALVDASRDDSVVTRIEKKDFVPSPLQMSS